MKNINLFEPFSKLFFIGFLIIMTFSCSYKDSYNVISDTGVGGSTSRFTIVQDHLYVIDNEDINVFDISNPENPNKLKEVNVGFQIETIFSLYDMLFIGSQFSMYIYDITIPDDPIKLSETSHIYSCDPVVADNKYAYVTLRNGSGCRGWSSDQLQIIDITDPENTSLVKTYSMSGPYGLAVKEDMLFVCDAYDVKVYDKSDVMNLDLLYTIDENVNDVIALDSILLLVNTQGIYEYSFNYDSASKLSEISKYND